MGAKPFIEWTIGRTASESYWDAFERAKAEHGNGGYTGTIAETDGYELLPLEAVDPADIESVKKRIDVLIDNAGCSGLVCEKWGPAGCFDLGPYKALSSLNRYVFFGWVAD